MSIIDPVRFQAVTLDRANLGFAPFPDVQPFSARSAIGYQDLLEGLYRYVTSTLFVYLTETNQQSVWDANSDKLIAAIESALVEQQQEVQADLNATLAEIVAGSNLNLNNGLILAALQASSSSALAYIRAAADARAARMMGYVVVTDAQWSGGAPIDGTDGTAAIEAAWAARAGRPLYFPSGNYLYSGSGLGVGSSPHIAVIGADANSTNIHLASGKRLIDVGTDGVLSLHITGIHTIGGAGVFRSSRTSMQVTNLDYSLIEKNVFEQYTQCAIERNSQDWPDWTIRKNVFMGDQFASTIGIALSGLTDGCLIENNSFPRNRIGIKLDRGGNNVAIRDNGFEHADGATRNNQTAYIWIVPSPTSTNAGQGCLIDHNRFGNENAQNLDKHIIIADEDTSVSGSTFGTRFPVLSSGSGGYIEGMRIRDCMFSGSDNGSNPSPVFTTCYNVRGMRIDGILNGTPPQYIVEFFQVVTTPLEVSNRNVIGPFIGPNTYGGPYAPLKPSNDHSAFSVIDPNELFAAATRTPIRGSAPSFTDWKRLLFAAPVAFAKFGSGTAVSSASSVPQAIDGDAGNVTLSAGGQIAGPLENPVVGGKPINIQFDALAQTLSIIRFKIVNSSGGVEHIQQVQLLGDEMHPYEFTFVPRSSGSGYSIIFEQPQGQAGTFRIQNVRVYHSRTRTDQEGTVVIGGNRYRLGVSNGAVTATAV